MKLNLVNYEKYQQVDKILYDDEIYANNIRKIYIYNPYVENAMHTFWYYIDKCKLINKNNISITIALPNNEKLIKSLISLDKHINNILCISDDNSSLIIKENSPTQMKLHIDSQTSFFSQDDTLSDLKLIENNSNLIIIVELAYILYKSKDNVTKFWRIIQAKKINNLNTKISLFNKQNILPVPKITPATPSLPPPPPNKEKIKFVPSVNELMDKLNNLKKNKN